MTPAARHQAAITVLDRVLAGEPAEKALTTWGRAARFAGSGDRAAIRDIVFDALRRRDSAARAGGGLTGRGLVLGVIRQAGADADAIFSGQGHAPAPLTNAERVLPALLPGPDLPDWLWQRFQTDLGTRAADVAEILRHRAPVTLRVDLSRLPRAGAQRRLSADGIATAENPLSPSALTLTDPARGLTRTALYAQGLIEMQDAASQAVVDALPLPPKGRVLDFCAGGGGKTLAMASRTKAALYAHDIAAARLNPLVERAARASVHVTRIAPGLAARHAPYDLVLCDVPCSGAGSWRRAPEAKWRLTSAALARLCETQAEILDQAAALVAPGGWLAYATCSVLSAENDAQAESFAARAGWTVVSRHHWLPGAHGDGFFLATLNRK
jgi:16S rRNA (cytosine967-C5)-methyltransferase